MYKQVLDPVSHSLGLTSIFAIMPLLVLFVLLGVARMKAQNLAVCAAAVGLVGREGDIFRRVVGWSVVLVLFLAVIVLLQSSGALSWMVP